MTEAELQTDIYRLRQQLEEKQQKLAQITQAKHQAQILEDIKNHPACPIVGKAYTDTNLTETLLVTVTIKGNSSSSQDISLRVAPGVATYFGNCIPSSQKYLFFKELGNQAIKWVQSQVETNPATVADLMDLSIHNRNGEKAKQWAIGEAVKNLANRFTKQQLEEAVSSGFHGRHLLNQAIKLKDREHRNSSSN